MKILMQGKTDSCKRTEPLKRYDVQVVPKRDMMSILCKLMQLEAFPYSIHVSRLKLTNWPLATGRS